MICPTQVDSRPIRVPYQPLNLRIWHKDDGIKVPLEEVKKSHPQLQQLVDAFIPGGLLSSKSLDF